MAELKPCRDCGEVPELELHTKDIPEAKRLYPCAVLRCKCKILEVVALNKRKAVEFAEEMWNEKNTKKEKEKDG